MPQTCHSHQHTHTHTLRTLYPLPRYFILFLLYVTTGVGYAMVMCFIRAVQLMGMPTRERRNVPIVTAVRKLLFLCFVLFFFVGCCCLMVLCCFRLVPLCHHSLPRPPPLSSSRPLPGCHRPRHFPWPCGAFGSRHALFLPSEVRCPKAPCLSFCLFLICDKFILKAPPVYFTHRS